MLIVAAILVIFLIGCSITGNIVKQGKIKIRTLPQNVTIYVNNVYAGQTPLTTKSLEPGKHLVNFSMTANKTYSAYIKVSPGKTTSVHLKF